MREIIVGYWDWFADFVKLHHDEITTISTIFIALFTVVLACVARRQIRDARILQRAYLDAKFGGIETNSKGDLIGRVIFRNVGHLPAQNFCWVVALEIDGHDWRPPRIKNNELRGKSIIPVGAEWPLVTNTISPPQSTGQYLYVWGRAIYKDGFRWRKRRTDFCHCYPWESKESLTGGNLIVSTEHARYHERGNSAT